MELDFVTSNLSGEEIYDIADNNDGSIFDGERCGICMDIIIDRGVLDCCQHWFCFVCIDNWATITNLCPLCQKEYQLITCVPVYDTIGSSKADDDSFRDDDWCIEGKNSTVSFPSYYIDEDAVVCLDGDGCKLRNTTAPIEEDSTLDTSIACDSCDIWYHAFCVGFDPDGTSEDTWLCPRCEVEASTHKSDVIPPRRSDYRDDLINADSEHMTENAFSGRVSVSVADDGETAVVVSMIGGGQQTEKSSENFLSTLNGENSTRTETFILTSDANTPAVETRLKEGTSTQTHLQASELQLRLSRDTSFSPPKSMLVSASNRQWIDGTRNRSMNSGVTKAPLKNSFEESSCKNQPSDNKSSISLQLGLSVGCFPSVGDTNTTRIIDQVTNELQPSNPSEETFLKGENTVSDAIQDTDVHGIKRKYTDYGDNVLYSADNEGTKGKIDNEVPVKKIKGQGQIQMTSSKGQVKASLSDDLTSHTGDSKGDGLKYYQAAEDEAFDIMSIIKETDSGSFRLRSSNKNSDKSSKEKESAAGLRVKKIMRRVGDDKESEQVVKELRKEIREVVRNRSSKDIGEHLFDPKLLDAFRVAVAGKTEPVKKLSPLSLKAKKSMLQKGKVRENLTKKIYRDSNGKRRRAWDRDCEIEFWKHRCTRYTRPEKVQTLNSVLDLLRKSSEGSEIEGKESICKPTNHILSRLYLADTSVFPRKDNIQPLSVLKVCGSEQNKDNVMLFEKGTEKATETNEGASKVGNTNNLSGSVGDTASKAHPNRHPGGPSTSSGSSAVKLRKEIVTKSGDVKNDKRKWALEVLARKQSVSSMNSKQQKEEGNAGLKGNDPLLAQLPIDMRPVLAASNHNKIPISVRQTQLYRLTEHFLRKTDLPVMRRTGETELAVADAINIEKEVANRSNSKLVYLNLCSQELLHRADGRSNKALESNPSPPSAIPIDRSEQAAEIDSTDPAVDEALKAAGLLSDSPPNSPQKIEVTDEKNDPIKKINDEELDNVIEMDSRPELDIYGDFEYDLEDEDYIGATAMKLSSLQPEEGVPKLKVVFSTLELQKSSRSLDGKENENVKNVDAANQSSCHSDVNTGDSTLNNEMDKFCVRLDMLSNEEGEEPSMAECEELYGPDKEPLLKRFPEEASRELSELVDNDDRAPEGNKDKKSQSVKGNSPKHPRTSRDIQSKEKKPDSDTDKKNAGSNSVSKKVEAYIKEHIRPLCKSCVITVEQYRWAVSKTTEKVMKHHCKAKNANFLIKEGEKVKKLAEQYVEAAQQK